MNNPTCILSFTPNKLCGLGWMDNKLRSADLAILESLKSARNTCKTSGKNFGSIWLFIPISGLCMQPILVIELTLNSPDKSSCGRLL